MSAIDLINDFVNRECWTTDTVVLVLCQFIDSLKLADRLQQFLAQVVRRA